MNLATNLIADLANDLLVGDGGLLAADLVADLADWLLVVIEDFGKTSNASVKSVT